MKSLVTFCIFLILFTLTSHGQDLSFKNDNSFRRPEAYNFLFEKIPDNYDFQLRLYFNSGGNKIIKETMLLITLKKGTWSTAKYIFTRHAYDYSNTVKIDTTILQVNDYNQLFTALKNDSLFTLKPLGTDEPMGVALQRKLIENGEVLSVWTDGGPPIYCVELLSPNAKRGFDVVAPKYYFDKYHLPELKNYVSVLQKLFDLMGISGPG